MKEIFLMVVKELRYLLLDKGVYARDYSDGAVYKPRGIWWLGRNRFIRFVASVVFKAISGSFGKGGVSSALQEARMGRHEL